MSIYFKINSPDALNPQNVVYLLYEILEAVLSSYTSSNCHLLQICGYCVTTENLTVLARGFGYFAEASPGAPAVSPCTVTFMEMTTFSNLLK